MSVYIRQATLADADAIKATDTIVPLDASRAILIDEWLERDTVLVAVNKEKILGYGVYNRAFFRQGQVEMLMIAADYRGQGTGKSLLLALEQLCDTPKFWVTTNLSNHPMQKLLSRLGYKPCGYIDELDPGDPELVYVKQLRH